uniref:Uncharacterized protein n=1 Tax=Anopheles culicifacies TaxID=139723 RepID=A0A182MI14_9DIPT
MAKTTTYRKLILFVNVKATIMQTYGSPKCSLYLRYLSRTNTIKRRNFRKLAIYVRGKQDVLLWGINCLMSFKSHYGSCFTICSINFFLLLGLGCKNAGLSLTLRYVNIRRTDTLGFENGGSFSSFRFDLHLHRFVYSAR